MDRRHFLLQTSAGFVGALSTRCAPQRASVDDRSQIEGLMTQLHERHLFTGEVLAAVKGNVIYEGAFGVADRSTRRPYTTDTRSCLASLMLAMTR